MKVPHTQSKLTLTLPSWNEEYLPFYPIKIVYRPTLTLIEHFSLGLIIMYIKIKKEFFLFFSNLRYPRPLYTLDKWYDKLNKFLASNKIRKIN